MQYNFLPHKIKICHFLVRTYPNLHCVFYIDYACKCNIFYIYYIYIINVNVMFFISIIHTYNRCKKNINTTNS